MDSLEYGASQGYVDESRVQQNECVSAANTIRYYTWTGLPRRDIEDQPPKT